ncbi:MAG TPA: copper homeostasis protein CutC [Bacteroidales bacterium]|jgi:copper homeostasis protein|nr:copper homeostasis protein CutC [Bacteroidales bacterium]
MNFRLEICSDSVESALIAQEAGADRIELCSSLIEGGVTPSYGTILSAREELRIPVHVLIRPRSGDFLYSEQEYEIMRREIVFCRQSGIDGVVFGILKTDGTVDYDRTARLADMSWPMSVTFHRAFDLCREPEKGLHDIISCGANRVLTSGQKNTAAEGIDLIHKLVKAASQKIIIMPGSGINDSNIKSIAEKTGASEFHLSARKEVQGMMQYRKNSISMGGNSSIQEYSRKMADPEKIATIRKILASS